MRNAAVLLLVLLTILLVGLFQFTSQTYARFPFARSGTLTLLTRPVEALPPHTHETTDTKVDSLLTPGHGIIVESDLFTAPEDMWLTGNEIVVVNAPRSVLHHLIFAKSDGPNSECPDRDEELYTVGADTQGSNAFPEPYGIFLAKGERVYLSGMIHNPLPPQGEGGSYENVSIGFRWSTERPSPHRTEAVEFHRLALQDPPYCQSLHLESTVDVFTVPAHTPSFVKSSDDTKDVNPTRHVFTEPGLILGFGAHLHPGDGGTQVAIFLNGEPVGVVVPEQLPDHPWLWRTKPKIPPHPVQAGDVLTLSTTYTNLRDVPISDAMGQTVFFFAPTLR